MDNNNNTLNIYESILAGSITLVFISYYFSAKYKYKKKKNIDNDDFQRKKVEESKILGYKILIDTVKEYNNNFPNGNFLDFMKKMWFEDYKILINSQNENSSCKRNYTEWENIFNFIKNKSK